MNTISQIFRSEYQQILIQQHDEYQYCFSPVPSPLSYIVKTPTTAIRFQRYPQQLIEVTPYIIFYSGDEKPYLWLRYGGNAKTYALNSLVRLNENENLFFRLYLDPISAVIALTLDLSPVKDLRLFSHILSGPRSRTILATIFRILICSLITFRRFFALRIFSEAFAIIII